MLFTQVGNDLNKDVFSFLHHKVMEHFEDTIDYATLIAYSLTQYYLNSGINELGEKGMMAVTEELSQLHMRDTFCPESAKHLTK